MQDLVLRSPVAPCVLSRNKRLALRSRREPTSSHPRLSDGFGYLALHAASSRASLLTLYTASPNPILLPAIMSDPRLVAFTNILPKFVWVSISIAAVYRDEVLSSYSGSLSLRCRGQQTGKMSP